MFPILQIFHKWKKAVLHICIIFALKVIFWSKLAPNVPHSVTEVMPCRVSIWLDSMLFSLVKSFKQLEKQDFELPDKTRNRQR